MTSMVFLGSKIFFGLVKSRISLWAATGNPLNLRTMSILRSCDKVVPVVPVAGTPKPFQYIAIASPSV